MPLNIREVPPEGQAIGSDGKERDMRAPEGGRALLTYVSKQLYFLLCLGCSCPAALLTDATGCLLIGVSPCTILQWTRGTSERLMLVPQPGWKYMEFITVQLNESQ